VYSFYFYYFLRIIVEDKRFSQSIVVPSVS